MNLELTPSPASLAVERWPLARLLPYAANARTHGDEQVKRIAASILEFGFNVPCLVDNDGVLIAGHGRLLAARQLSLDIVPVIRLGHLTDAQARAFRIADNKLTELGGWDEELLRTELAALSEAGFDVSLTGFEEAELDRLLADAFGTEGLTEADAVVDPPAQPGTRTGDLWLLGDHRLLCGDATNKADVDRVLAGALPRLMATDPPYGIELDMEWRDRAGRNGLGPAERSYMRSDGHRNTTISGDTRADWSAAFDLVPSLDTAYVWHASSYAIEVGLGLRRIGFELKQQIIWMKPHFALSRTNYHWQHEPCWYARKPGAAPFRGRRDQSTIWEAASPKMLMTGSDEEKFDHPTQKPLVLFTRPIENHTGAGEAVYEPFAGSGTAFVAAEKTGRHCLGLELDPRYCDVIVRRWQDFTGKAAVLEGGEQTFDAVANQRLGVAGANAETAPAEAGAA